MLFWVTLYCNIILLCFFPVYITDPHPPENSQALVFLDFNRNNSSVCPYLLVLSSTSVVKS